MPHLQLLVSLWGCHGAPLDTSSASAPDAVVYSVTDHSASFAGHIDGHYERNRACAPADFDGDGRLDIVIAAPGDSVRILLNRTEQVGDFKWVDGQVLAEGTLGWSLGAADFDNDGDPDLVIGNGGNEGEEANQLFRNDDGTMVDITPDEVAGPHGLLGVLPTATAGVVWADFDQDGFLDLFLSTNVPEREPALDVQPNGHDQLLLGRGDGTFYDITLEAGMDRRAATFNATAFDADNDGDTDIYQNVLAGKNALWDNRLDTDNGFVDTTVLASAQPTGTSLEQPLFKSFSSAGADMNNDGLMDLFVWNRGPAEGGQHVGHLMFLNLPDVGLIDVADYTGVNDTWEQTEGDLLGVMGSQLGDLNLDGIPDIFTGTGGPPSGNNNELWFSTGFRVFNFDGMGSIDAPQYENVSYLIDRPVDGAESVPFPYRTHGACVADFDGDGRPELAYVNGGPAASPDAVREPNRLFSVHSEPPNHFLTIRPVGNGVSTNRDAIGTRMRVEAGMPDGSKRTFYNTLLRGTGFSSHNGPELIVGLGQALMIHSVTIIWPDGTVQQLADTEMDQRLVLQQP